MLIWALLTATGLTSTSPEPGVPFIMIDHAGRTLTIVGEDLIGLTDLRLGVPIIGTVLTDEASQQLEDFTVTALNRSVDIYLCGEIVQDDALIIDPNGWSSLNLFVQDMDKLRSVHRRLEARDCEP